MTAIEADGFDGGAPARRTSWLADPRLDFLTAGQRYTAALAGLVVVGLVLFGMPSSGGAGTSAFGGGAVTAQPSGFGLVPSAPAPPALSAPPLPAPMPAPFTPAPASPTTTTPPAPPSPAPSSPPPSSPPTTEQPGPALPLPIPTPTLP